ncbi:MAG: hypothetical protein M1524_01255, partial [Patescibacteria group bacterium]|nr:hypothetical protein [Patescibacteria group bacterium]
IRTYESETLEDSVVSFYPCYIHAVGAKTKLSSSVTPDKKFFIESQIDPLERDGDTLNGFRILQDKIGDKKGDRMFLWISPRGPAGTEGIFKHINYGYHQIYLGAIKDGKSETYALKSDVKEEVLATWINQVSNGETSVKGETPCDFLLNPVVVPFGSPDFSSENAISAVLYKLKEILKQNNQTKFYDSVDIDDLPFVIKKEKIKQDKDVERISRQLESHFSSDKYLD